MTPQQKRRALLEREWKTISAVVLQRDNYLCLTCREVGKYEPASCTNHVLGRKYKSLFLDPRYLISSCAKCNRSDEADTVEARKWRVAILYSEYDYDYSDCPDKQYMELI